MHRSPSMVLGAGELAMARHIRRAGAGSEEAAHEHDELRDFC